MAMATHHKNIGSQLASSFTQPLLDLTHKHLCLCLHIVFSADTESSLEDLLGSPDCIHHQKIYNVLAHYVGCDFTP